MYKIKSIPNDFIVEELPSFEMIEEGRYSYFLLEKENMNSIDAVSIIAKRLRIPLKRIKFAGNKDKNAVTKQYISIEGADSERVQEFDNFSIKFIGRGDRPLSLGSLKGNRFTITVRNLEEVSTEEGVYRVVNYFDEQRFSEKNVRIGKAIVQKRFKDAVGWLSEYDHKMTPHLEKNYNDYVGALRKVQLRLLRFFIHSYQSYLWNCAVSRYVSGGKRVKYSLGEFVFPDRLGDNLDIPLIGFDSEFGEFKEIYTDIMDREGINREDFIIRQIPELSSEGGLRKLYFETELKVLDSGDDELNGGKKKVKIQFELPKGSYATIFVKFLFS